jgi:cation diffusion facilitator CzcD-associated flavoprotein CzcO
MSFGPDEINEYLPSYGFGCRRSSPVHAFAQHLHQENVDVVKAAVTEFTEDGIIDSAGNEKKVDVIICATGFHPSVPMYDVIGRDGRSLATEIPDGKSYLSVMHDGFPNMFCKSRSNYFPTSEKQMKLNELTRN